MALKGVSESLGARGIQSDLKVVSPAVAGTVYMLGSQSNYVQLASQAVSHVLHWDVTAAGLAAADIVLGVEKQVTKANDHAHLRALAPGDTFRTDALASGGDTGAIDGGVNPNEALGVNPTNGKIRKKQATDTELFRLAPDGGNLFNTDGSIWVEVVRLV